MVKSLTRNELLELITEGKVSNRLCSATGEIIPLHHGYYILGDHSILDTPSIDIDKVIHDRTDGEYSSSKELYNEPREEHDTFNDNDFFYWTEQSDAYAILEDILENEEAIFEEVNGVRGVVCTIKIIN